MCHTRLLSYLLVHRCCVQLVGACGMYAALCDAFLYGDIAQRDSTHALFV